MPLKSLETIIGDAYYRSGCRPFSLAVADRLQHVYVVGQTGVGKSTLLAQLAEQDLKAGRSVFLLDPHGDLVGTLARLFPACVYWNVADPACPYGYNPLAHVIESHRPLVASGLIETLKQQWADAWGPRMEHLLRYALLALLSVPDTDLRDVLPLFIDKDYRRRVVGRITDPQVRWFWETEFKALRYDRTLDGLSPIANKLGAFLAHPLVRQTICTPKEPLRFRRMMDQGQGLLVNLATGRLGADAANVLGGLVLSSIAHAGYSRADTPSDERTACFVYVDEFASFSTLSLATMLPQLRKYGVGLTLCHQYLEQLDRNIAAAVFGNAGNILVFRVGAPDMTLLAAQLGIEEPERLLGLRNYECLARVMVNGERTPAFSTILTSVGG